MENLGQRIDLHAHSLLSDGLLIPSEVFRRAQALDYAAIALTDHADASNIDSVIRKLVKVSQEINKHTNSTILIPGVELTHIPPASIENLAKRAKSLGAKIVLVHGETLAEPVMVGTNRKATESEDVDILAHPGLISVEDSKIAQKNGVMLEISCRKGHCLANGHVARVANAVGAKLVVNTDTHAPDDFLSQSEAVKVALGAGIPEAQLGKILIDNPRELVRKLHPVT